MLLELLSGFIALIGLFYVLLSWKWTYWTKKGVYQMPTKFPFGTTTEFFTKSRHFNDLLKIEAQEAENLPYYGGYFLHYPVLIIKGNNPRIRDPAYNWLMIKTDHK